MATTVLEQRVSAQRFYRPELEVLRFLAFGMVFLHHLYIGGNTSRLELAGAFGVPVFFCLSAYLITELLTREKVATGTVNLKSFYVWRILRIWPLYFAALFGGFVFSHCIHGRHPISLLALLAYVFLVGNWHAALHGYLPYGMGVLWSIGVEEQFYANRQRILVFCGGVDCQPSVHVRELPPWSTRNFPLV